MDLVRDANSEYPMMLPTSTQFSTYMTELGLHPNDVLVIYDAFETGLHSSPRVAWICQYFGHRAVHVLNNFPRYVYEALPVCHGRLPSLALTPHSGPQPGYPVQQPLASKVISFEELRDMIVNPSSETRFQIIDARPSDRFLGADGDAVASVLSGHMPSAINVPLSTILGPDKALLPPVDLKALFTKAGVMENIPTVLSCNSGVTAAALDLALRASGFQMETKLYDGSWSEWAKRAHKESLIINK
ncbi:hypothetical protein CBS147337_7009 [Penicillium roqueforti]|nr:hypothetical protein CBS147337_7009 [Penicillium roqueforti]